jgi:hypothetical protein
MTLECRDTKLWPVLWVHHKCLYLEGQSKKKSQKKKGKKHTHTQKSPQEDLSKKKSKKHPQQ